MLRAFVLLIAAVVIVLIVRAFAQRRQAPADRRSSVREFEAMFSRPLSEVADAFLTSCDTEFNEKQRAFEKTWLANYTRYDIDSAKSLLVITKPDTRIAFDVEFVGSTQKEDRSWEWGWNNTNVPSGEAVFPKSGLEEIGRKFSLPYLLEGIVPVPEEAFPVYLTSIALKASPDALGVFVAKSDGMEFFYLVRKPREYKP
jgi:hypothetical protein